MPEPVKRQDCLVLVRESDTALVLTCGRKMCACFAGRLQCKNVLDFVCARHALVNSTQWPDKNQRRQGKEKWKSCCTFPTCFRLCHVLCVFSTCTRDTGLPAINACWHVVFHKIRLALKQYWRTKHPVVIPTGYHRLYHNVDVVGLPKNVKFWVYNSSTRSLCVKQAEATKTHLVLIPRNAHPAQKLYFRLNVHVRAPK